jgi:hypothetical protein
MLFRVGPLDVIASMPARRFSCMPPQSLVPWTPGYLLYSAWESITASFADHAQIMDHAAVQGTDRMQPIPISQGRSLKPKTGTIVTLDS